MIFIFMINTFSLQSKPFRRWCQTTSTKPRVGVQGVKSLGGHFTCLCRGFKFYEVKEKHIIIFKKEYGNTFTLLIIFIVKSLQKEQNSTNLLLWPQICRNKHAITPKWFNSFYTNSNVDPRHLKNWLMVMIRDLIKMIQWGNGSKVSLK